LQMKSLKSVEEICGHSIPELERLYPSFEKTHYGTHDGS
jgi:hypothetical protein